ncbi:MAG: S8 family serine peptidase [Burkholderiales bacterium]|nr:S8 family serine peptidase [Burkholderiales bacterium]
MRSHEGDATAPPTAVALAATRRGAFGPGLLALVASGFMLFACGGGGGGDAPAAAAKPPTTQAGSVALDVLGVAPSSVTGKVVASDPQGLPLTYTVTTAPSVGTVAVDANSGNFTYSVSGNPSAGQDTFTVSVSNGRAAATSATVTVALNTDPLLANQWHIRNDGASAFSSVLPTAGNDMNVAGAWAAGYSGKGIKVAVVDTGLEIGHEDLATNVDAAASYNFLTGTGDPSPAGSGTDHGTQVAGIIGSVAFNGKGGRGVAYGARLRGYNLLESYSVSNYAAAMGGMAISADNAIFNASFGEPTPALAPFDQAIVNANGNLNSLRGGLGAILVNSAGNTFKGFAGADPALCAVANQYGVSCGNPAQDTRLGGTTPIIVGAINAEGKRSSYSTTASSLWVSAPGGEFGFDSTYYDVSGFADPAVMVKPAIVTTARAGCANRNKAPDVANALVTGNNRLALNCQYTAQMNGTSSAAPNAAATVALMLEANPRLSARDVKFILAKTARRIDPELASVTSTEVVVGAAITLEQGWVRNAAGHWFSNSYGFGAVDAAAAVDMARSYTSYLPASKTSDSYSTTPRAGVTVPALSTSGYVITAAVDEPFTTVEQVIVFPNIAATPSLACNQIEVVSPSGTKSILLHAANGFAQTSATGTRMLSNAFYGEPVNGSWKITYFNFCSGQTLLSATQPQTFLFVGR